MTVILQTKDVCPKCGKDRESGYGVMSGYGFAFGGGIGVYYFCLDDRCDWFRKDVETEGGCLTGERDADR